MPRPARSRRICAEPQVKAFSPDSPVCGEPILLTLDEYEVIRLVDLQQRTHEQCAAQMDISRSTVQEIYESARRKLAACLVHGKPLRIGGGAQAALAEAGIKLYGGVSGEADAAVAALLVGNLGYDPDVHCYHHDHEHGKGGHSCGDHGCGHHSCH